MEAIQFPTQQALGAVHSFLLDLEFLFNFGTVNFPDCPVCCSIRCQSDLSEVQHLLNIL